MLVSISMVMTLFATNSYYILGGMLFRKSAWLKASLAFVLLTIIVFSLFVGYAYLVYKYTDYVVYIPEWVSNSWFSCNVQHRSNSGLLLSCLPHLLQTSGHQYSLAKYLNSYCLWIGLFAALHNLLSQL